MSGIPAQHPRRCLPAFARVLSSAILLGVFLGAVPAHAATFNPLNIISYETWRASTSMSVADIQAFLEVQSGPLKSLVTTDYMTPGGSNSYGIPWKKGQPKKSAAQIIGDASTYWNINPKVLLATLQKEQSLISVSNSSNATRLRKAMGYGIYSGSTNTFPGFGNQVFNAARGFSQYETRYGWVPGMKTTVELLSTGKLTTIVPLNACTYGLYKYTPYYPQVGFWNQYTHFFEDPLAPPRMRPVYRFRGTANGTYYYTASEAKRYTLIRTASKTWKYEGVSFSCDTSAAANTVPLYQMHNTRTHKYLYTTLASTRDKLLKVRPSQWHCDGTVCYVARVTAGTAPVYKLERKTTHAVAYISSASLKKSWTTGHSALFYDRGVGFRLDSLVTTSTPVGPAS
jgi:hypothetical protein